MSNLVDVQPLLRWLGTQHERPHVVLACREQHELDRWRVPDVETQRVVFLLPGCLADVAPAGLLEVLAMGTPSVTAVLAGCAASDAAAEVVARADTIARALGLQGRVLQLTEPPGEERALGVARPGRRHVGRLAGRSATVPLLDAGAMPVSRRALVSGQETEVAQTAEDASGQRLFRVVRQLLGDAPIPDALEAVPTGAADLSAPGCDASGVCVRVCPTDALTLTLTGLDGDGSSAAVNQFVLELAGDRCVDCGLCVQQCPAGAMQRVAALSWRDALAGTPRTVRAALAKRCPRCGAMHREAGPRCGPCSFRAASPFGSRLPLGFTQPGRAEDRP